jgi:ABC-type amino acid transport system permease subunit|tara:strand:+ start:233 stop:445 length:213 start_codon:yes stop_codon:yes gene_type:complete
MLIVPIKKESTINNKFLIGLLGTILLGLGTWVLVSIIELQVLIAMMSEELMNIDKQMGRIYAHMDRLMSK